MAHLLHLDSSIRAENSRSRRLSARYAEAWQRANPGGTVTYRDLAADPIPHFSLAAFEAGFTPADQRTPEQQAEFAITEQLANEVLAASAIVIGSGLYNYNVPSTVKAWADRLIVPGLTLAADGSGGLLGGRTVALALAAGGGYSPGTPKDGWNHHEPWQRHFWESLGVTELEVYFAELTLARENPAMAPLNLGDAEDASIAAAEAAIDARFAPQPVAA